MRKDKAYYMKAFKEGLIKQVKSLALPVILLAIIVAGIWVIINFQNAVEPVEIIKVNGYEGTEDPMILENEYLKFTLDPTTTHFEVLVKSSGKVWKSNPDGVNEDPIAQAAEKGNLNSTLILTFTKETGLITTFGNYNYGINNQVYEIYPEENQIRVNYSIGETEREYIIPPVAKVDDFEGYMAQMSLEDVNLVKQYYKLYDINKLSKKDQEKKDELLEKYPIMETEPVYVLRDTTKANLKIKFEGVFEALGYTYEQYQADKELDFSSASSDKPVFNVNMIYSLDGDKLKVEVPFSEIEYREESPIYSLTVLPYFGAAGTSQEGFLLVPEGGGAIINMNNGKSAQNAYVANVYGWDMGLVREELVHATRTYFNTFGISEGNDSFLCTMENGASYAAVQADVSGRFHSYNYVNANYSMVHREKYDVGEIANSDIYVFEDKLPDESIIQEYRFIDSGSYVDMAKEYQTYLSETYGEYFAENPDDSTPVELEIVTAVDKKRQVLGVPVSRPLELTSFDEATDIVNELAGEGFKNASIKLTGWCNGGVKQKILKRISPTNGLGGTKKLQNFIDTANNLGMDVYLNGITNYAYNSNLLNGFFSYTDAAKFITKERAELFTFSDVTYATREGLPSYYLLHTDVALQMAQNLIDKADSLRANVSFQDIGIDLAADYYKKNPVSREATLKKQEELLKKTDDAGTKVMINMGNDYAMPYADMITNMDLKGSGYTILDVEVPFYQMAIHGYINYVGFPVNTNGNAQEEILRSAEYGAGLSFSLMKETPFTLQKTLYTQYYGSDYNTYHDEMVEIYNNYNSKMGHVFNQKMVDHKSLGAKLRCTTYEDGTKVYVNYSYADATTDDGVVPARDFIVVK